MHVPCKMIKTLKGNEEGCVASFFEKLEATYEKYRKIIDGTALLDSLKEMLVSLIRPKNIIFSVKEATQQSSKIHLAIISSNLAELRALDNTLKEFGFETQFKIPMLLIFPKEFHRCMFEKLEQSNTNAGVKKIHL
jgi:hypothetical protein